MEQYLQIGKIVNTHGYKGTVKLQPWCDSPYDAAELDVIYKKKGSDFVPYSVETASVHKDAVLLKLEGVDDFDSANALRETVMYADRNDIPKAEGSFFIADIIGLDVIDADTGKVYGKLNDVLGYGHGDIYEVKTEKGNVLVPAVGEFIKNIDTDKGIFIKPIEGMFDEI